MLESDDYLALPSKWEIDEYRIMERFCYTVEEDQQEQLLNAISGRGAFRYFKDTLARLGLREEWYRYRDEALAEIAVDWLESHGIPYLKKMQREP